MSRKILADFDELSISGSTFFEIDDSLDEKELADAGGNIFPRDTKGPWFAVLRHFFKCCHFVTRVILRVSGQVSTFRIPYDATNT